MKSDLWLEYDAVLERLRAARERTAQAQAEERALEAEVASAREAIERAVAVVAVPKADKKPKTVVSSFPSLGQGAAGLDEPSGSRPAPAGVLPTIWEVILAIPRDGALRGSDLREKLGLSEGAVNTRLANAKHAKMIETAGWGMYKLTEQGRALQGQHLRVVATNNNG
jgi:hypothetical protein